MTSRTELTIAGQQLKAAAWSHIDLPVARLATGAWMSLPITVLRGKHAGPTVFVSAAIHGDELNGIDIIRQVLAKLSPKTFTGTLIAVPIVNVFGFIEQSRYLPDRRDLNRAFPGSARGSLASRLAYLFMNEIVLRSDAGIDLHTGSHHRYNLPQIRINQEHEQSLALAKNFAAPIILGANERSGSLRAAATKHNIPVLLYEAGEPLRFNQDAIAMGRDGVLRVLAKLGMIEANPEPIPTSVLAEGSRWLRASRSGICHLQVSPGQWVHKDDTAALIMDAYGQQQRKMRVPVDGLVIGHSTNPLVQQGDAVLHIAYT